MPRRSLHTGYLAQQGLVALGFANSPAVMAPVGGRNPVIGTNPFSFAAPGRKGRVAFLVDMASSASSWTAVKQAAEKGEPLPPGCSVSSAAASRPPTPRPRSTALLAPAAGPKGFALGLVVEAMSAALAGANRGVEMGSMTDDDGLPVGSGQFLHRARAEDVLGRPVRKQIERLIASVTSQPEARMPNDRRAANLKRGLKNGLTIDKGPLRPHQGLYRTQYLIAQKKR